MAEPERCVECQAPGARADMFGVPGDLRCAACARAVRERLEAARTGGGPLARGSAWQQAARWAPFALLTLAVVLVLWASRPRPGWGPGPAEPEGRYLGGLDRGEEPARARSDRSEGSPLTAASRLLEHLPAALDGWERRQVAAEVVPAVPGSPGLTRASATYARGEGRLELALEDLGPDAAREPSRHEERLLGYPARREAAGPGRPSRLEVLVRGRLRLRLGAPGLDIADLERLLLRLDLEPIARLVPEPGARRD